MTRARVVLPALGLAMWCSVAAAGDRTRVVTTTSDLRSLAQEVGKERIEALRLALSAPPSNRRPAVLIAPETAAATQSALIRYWKPKGLTLEFAPAR